MGAGVGGGMRRRGGEVLMVDAEGTKEGMETWMVWHRCVDEGSAGGGGPLLGERGIGEERKGRDREEMGQGKGEVLH